MNLDSDLPPSKYLEWKFSSQNLDFDFQQILAKWTKKGENGQKRAKHTQNLRYEVRFRFPTLKLVTVEIFM